MTGEVPVKVTVLDRKYMLLGVYPVVVFIPPYVKLYPLVSKVPPSTLSASDVEL